MIVVALDLGWRYFLAQRTEGAQRVRYKPTPLNPELYSAPSVRTCEVKVSLVRPPATLRTSAGVTQTFN